MQAKQRAVITPHPLVLLKNLLQPLGLLLANHQLGRGTS
jgi:hypothetical protein